MANSSREDLSDDEIFIGKLTIKEIKKHIFMNSARCTTTNTQDKHNLSLINKCDMKKEDQNTSFKLIQSQSQPNLNSHSPCPNYRASDASFLEMEDLVEKLCLSPSKTDTCEKLDNTFERMEYILKQGPSKIKEHVNFKIETEDTIKVAVKQEHKSPEIDSTHRKAQTTILKIPNIKVEKSNTKKVNTAKITSAKKIYNYADNENYHTPLTSLKPKQLFNTPMNTPISSKKALSVKRSRIDVPKYPDIMSPVAAYINHSPRAPLVQNVHHKKTLTGLSLIPKSNKTYTKTANKENMKLPFTAYKSAKKTQLIDLPEDKKIPKSSKKTPSSIPKPMIIKHTHREMVPKNPMATNTEDSFANLSCHQAEVSVCTQKSAYKNKKN